MDSLVDMDLMKLNGQEIDMVSTLIVDATVTTHETEADLASYRAESAELQAEIAALKHRKKELEEEIDICQLFTQRAIAYKSAAPLQPSPPKAASGSSKWGILKTSILSKPEVIKVFPAPDVHTPVNPAFAKFYYQLEKLELARRTSKFIGIRAKAPRAEYVEKCATLRKLVMDTATERSTELSSDIALLKQINADAVSTTLSILEQRPQPEERSFDQLFTSHNKSSLAMEHPSAPHTARHPPPPPPSPPKRPPAPAVASPVLSAKLLASATASVSAAAPPPPPLPAPPAAVPAPAHSHRASVSFAPLPSSSHSHLPSTAPAPPPPPPPSPLSTSAREAHATSPTHSTSTTHTNSYEKTETGFPSRRGSVLQDFRSRSNSSAASAVSEAEFERNLDPAVLAFHQRAAEIVRGLPTAVELQRSVQKSKGLSHLRCDDNAVFDAESAEAAGEYKEALQAHCTETLDSFHWEMERKMQDCLLQCKQALMRRTGPLSVMKGDVVFAAHIAEVLDRVSELKEQLQSFSKHQLTIRENTLAEHEEMVQDASVTIVQQRMAFLTRIKEKLTAVHQRNQQKLKEGRKQALIGNSTRFQEAMLHSALK